VKRFGAPATARLGVRKQHGIEMERFEFVLHNHRVVRPAA